ncbi:DUF3253 domain-containing protein [Acidovorax sp.]|uniref:DUF3253 domain-containing protein n=1 Tax=Acidovorax sp. TaxID=1872122 RepID=UPI00391AB00C
MTDADVEAKIFALLALRQAPATICPSEVARALAPQQGDWRPLMPHVRQVAQALAQQQRLRVTRGGVPVAATAPGGPIRLGLPPQGGER